VGEVVSCDGDYINHTREQIRLADLSERCLFKSV